MKYKVSSDGSLEEPIVMVKEMGYGSIWKTEMTTEEAYNLGKDLLYTCLKYRSKKCQEEK